MKASSGAILSLLLPLYLAPLCLGQDRNSRHRTITGNVQSLDNFHSSILNSDRTLTVYLPRDYATSPGKRYSVMYMCDGQNLFNLERSFLPNQEWRVDESAESLIEANLIEPVIIVGVDNAGGGRTDEYTPTAAKQRDGSMVGGKADVFGRVLVEEIKPFIDKNFRTKVGAQSTGLGGSSLGGLVTMYLGIKYPSVFGKLAVLSPSVWWDKQVLLKYVDAIPRKSKQKIWIDFGTHEPLIMSAGAEALRDHLVAKGWKSGKDLAFFRDYDADHNEVAWAHRYPSVLTFLFPPR